MSLGGWGAEEARTIFTSCARAERKRDSPNHAPVFGAGVARRGPAARVGQRPSCVEESARGPREPGAAARGPLIIRTLVLFVDPNPNAFLFVIDPNDVAALCPQLGDCGSQIYFLSFSREQGVDRGDR